MNVRPVQLVIKELEVKHTEEATSYCTPDVITSPVCRSGPSHACETILSDDAEITTKYSLLFSNKLISNQCLTIRNEQNMQTADKDEFNASEKFRWLFYSVLQGIFLFNF